jgi:hypothetical protein
VSDIVLNLEKVPRQKAGEDQGCFVEIEGETYEVTPQKLRPLFSGATGQNLTDDQHAFLHAAAENRHIRFAEKIKQRVYPTVFKLTFQSPKVRCPEVFALISNCLAELRLDYSWVQNAAWDVLDFCFEHSIKPNEPLSGNPFQPTATTAPEPFLFPPWPFGYSERDYRKLATQSFLTQLEGYIIYLKQQRAIPERPKRNRNLTVSQRYECAALRVCLQWTYEDIANAFQDKHPEGITTQAVQASITKICKGLGLPT